MGEIRVSPTDKKMLKDFGFKNYYDLHKYFNILYYGKKDRSKVYRFKWRLKMMSNYKNFKSPIKDEIIKFHTGYEDFVLQYRSGAQGVWPQKTLKQYAFLLNELQNPWHIDNTYKIKSLYSISDPNKNLWFRAISHYEMIEALDICYKNFHKFPTKTKTKNYPCKLKWGECVASFSEQRNTHSKYYPGMTPELYDVALIICDNITSTWNTKTGNWKPWKNKWLQRAYSDISLDDLRNKNFKFKDVASYVNTSATKGHTMAFYMLGVAYGVGGTRAARHIKAFARRKGLSLNLKRSQNNKNIPNASRTYKTIGVTKRYNKLMDNLNPFK